MVSLKDQAQNYDLESLRRSLLKHDENIRSLDSAVDNAERVISEEENMISVINRPDNTTNPELVRIDSGRIRDNMDRHRAEISLFKSEIKEEEARRRDTERLIMYLEE